VQKPTIWHSYCLFLWRNCKISCVKQGLYHTPLISSVGCAEFSIPLNGWLQPLQLLHSLKWSKQILTLQLILTLQFDKHIIEAECRNRSTLPKRRDGSSDTPSTSKSWKMGECLQRGGFGRRWKTGTSGWWQKARTSERWQKMGTDNDAGTQC
jgi:hypothetical protein